MWINKLELSMLDVLLFIWTAGYQSYETVSCTVCRAVALRQDLMVCSANRNVPLATDFKPKL